MRDIRFRAWDKINKLMWSWKEARQNRLKMLDDNSLFDWMQYTGLLDKNGKEIYEGDIVAIRRDNDKEWETGDCERAVIEYYNNYGAFVLEIYTVFGGEGYESLAGGEVGKYYRDRIEVIGNIYSNPDLLEAKHG